jgi:hypothetical protein
VPTARFKMCALCSLTMVTGLGLSDQTLFALPSLGVIIHHLAFGKNKRGKIKGETNALWKYRIIYMV